MANFYWYGGTGNWSEFLTHWSGNSGNSPPSPKLNVPTSSDDVFIDSNSGFGAGGTITLDVTASCNNFLANSGHTFTITSDAFVRIDIYGNFTLESTITFSITYLNFFSTKETTITTAGVSLDSNVNIWGIGSFLLQDDLVITKEFYHENGTFDANDHNVTANDFYFYADTGFTPTVVMGNGTWEAVGNGWYAEEYSGEEVIITPETSTIKLSSSVALKTNYIEYYDGVNYVDIGKTYNNVWFSENGTGNSAIIYGSNTFNNLKINAGISILFTQGTTQTVSSFTAVGTIGNLITLNSENGIDQFTLSKSSGIVGCDYLDISNSNSIGGASWYAGSHSNDTTNNDGWIFTDFLIKTILGLDQASVKTVNGLAIASVKTVDGLA